MNEKNQEEGGKVFKTDDIVVLWSESLGIQVGHVIRVTEGLLIVKIQGLPGHVGISPQDGPYRVVDLQALFNGDQNLRYAVNCLIEEMESYMLPDEVEGRSKEPSDIAMLNRMPEDRVEALITQLRDAEQAIWWETRFLG